MSVGLLLITHNGIGEQMLATARATYGGSPLESKTLRVDADTDPEKLLALARSYRQHVDDGDGVLVLTDCFGSTPSNIAGRLLGQGDVQVVSGISLPMLMRVLNYASLALAPLAEKAVSGGCEGIVVSNPNHRHDES